MAVSLAEPMVGNLVARKEQQMAGPLAASWAMTKADQLAEKLADWMEPSLEMNWVGQRVATRADCLGETMAEPSVGRWAAWMEQQMVAQSATRLVDH